MGNFSTNISIATTSTLLPVFGIELQVVAADGIHGVHIVVAVVRNLRDFSSRSRLVEESDFLGFETRYRNGNRWISRIKAGIGIVQNALSCRTLQRPATLLVSV